MGTLTELKYPVVRKAVKQHRGRPYVVTLLPGDVIEFREQWQRKGFSAPLAAVFDQVIRWTLADTRLRKKPIDKDGRR
jgi:hypothetical protein